MELTSGDLIPANPLDLAARTLMFTPAGDGYSREVRALDRQEEAADAERMEGPAEVALDHFRFPFAGREWDSLLSITVPSVSELRLPALGRGVPPRPERVRSARRGSLPFPVTLDVEGEHSAVRTASEPHRAGCGTERALSGENTAFRTPLARLQSEVNPSGPRFRLMDPNGSHHCRAGRASRQAAPIGAGREARARQATPTYTS